MSETSTAGVKNNLLRRAALAGMFAAAELVDFVAGGGT